jgi:site-specific DNA recombinase
LAKTANRNRAKPETRRGGIKRDLGLIADAILRGAAANTLAERAKALEAEQAEVESKLAEASKTTNMVALHPRALNRYMAILADLQCAVCEGVDNEEALALARELISSGVVHAPVDSDALTLDFEGSLAVLTQSRMRNNDGTVSSIPI